MGKSKSIRKYRRKTYKKKRSARRKQKGGDCGCNKPLITGGNINPASFDGSLSPTKYYPLNTYENDPNNPSTVVGGRMLPNGSADVQYVQSGGRRRRKSRKIKGGDILLGNHYSTNPFVNFGTTDGAIYGSRLITGATVVDPSPLNQPILTNKSYLA